MSTRTEYPELCIQIVNREQIEGENPSVIPADGNLLFVKDAQMEMQDINGLQNALDTKQDKIVPETISIYEKYGTIYNSETNQPLLTPNATDINPKNIYANTSYGSLVYANNSGTIYESFDLKNANVYNYTMPEGNGYLKLFPNCDITKYAYIGKGKILFGNSVANLSQVTIPLYEDGTENFEQLVDITIAKDGQETEYCVVVSQTGKIATSYDMEHWDAIGRITAIGIGGAQVQDVKFDEVKGIYTTVVNVGDQGFDVIFIIGNKGSNIAVAAYSMVYLSYQQTVYPLQSNNGWLCNYSIITNQKIVYLCVAQETESRNNNAIYLMTNEQGLSNNSIQKVYRIYITQDGQIGSSDYDNKFANFTTAQKPIGKVVTQFKNISTNKYLYSFNTDQTNSKSVEVQYSYTSNPSTFIVNSDVTLPIDQEKFVYVQPRKTLSTNDFQDEYKKILEQLQFNQLRQLEWVQRGIDTAQFYGIIQQINTVGFLLVVTSFNSVYESLLKNAYLNYKDFTYVDDIQVSINFVGGSITINQHGIIQNWDGHTNPFFNWTDCVENSQSSTYNMKPISICGFIGKDDIKTLTIRIGDNYYIVKNDLTLELITSSGGGVAGDVSLTKEDLGLGNVDNTSDVNKPISTATQASLDLKLSDAQGSIDGNNKQYARKNGSWTVVSLTKSDVGLGNVENKSIDDAIQEALDNFVSVQVTDYVNI